MKEVPKVNPWGSLEESILYNFKERVGWSDKFFYDLQSGEADISEIESKRICAILGMERSIFWHNLYKNNKPPFN